MNYSVKNKTALRFFTLLLSTLLYSGTGFAQCNNSSAAYLNKYKQQSFYVPTANDPLITIKLTYHVFIDGNGNGYDPNIPVQWAKMQDLKNWMSDDYDRYALPRIASYRTDFVQIPPYDSRVRYEVTNIYVYTNASLFTSTNSWGILDHIKLIDSNRIKEGMPVIFNSCAFAGYTGHAGSHNGLPFVHTSATPYADHWWTYGHLRHEMGHVVGWQHLYGMDELINNPCNSGDFLSDVFPSNNVNCPPANCQSCYAEEDTTNYSNNVMCQNGIPHGNEWISGLQQGRRIRNLHLKWNNLRFYARDTASQHTNPWLITSNETWDFDIQMYRDIVVKAGNTLIITCKVAMAYDGKIVVEKGAKLVIDGGEVTGWCKKIPTGFNNNYGLALWTGIEVDGNPSQSQLINNATGYDANHGIVQVKNGGKISHAFKGINTSLTNVAGALTAGTSGGIVIATDAVFENNVYDIIFYKYQKGTTRSKIENSLFTTTGEIGYDINNALIAPKEHIKLFDNWGLNIKGCEFSYAAGSIYPQGKRGIGLYTTDSHFTVDDLNPTDISEFNNLWMGIYIDNWNSIYTATIRNTDFNGNEFGTKVENCHYLKFYDNTINVPSYGIGMYLFRSKYYDVRSNVFTGTGYTDACQGLIAYESGEGLHQVYRNTFTDFNTGINCEDNNGGMAFGGKGLKMNCNVFDQGNLNGFDIAMNPVNNIPIVMTQQSISNPQSSSDLVKNAYGAVLIQNFAHNKWYVDGSNQQAIVHQSTQFGTDNPHNPAVAASPQVIVSAQAGWFINYANDCPAWTSSGGGNANSSVAQKLAVMNSHITDLRSFDPEEYDQEVQATVASKLHMFLTDTLDHNDSIIAILQSNQGNMDDADIQLVFAYLRMNDYEEAEDAIAGLPAVRADWQGMLGKILEIEQDDDGIYGFFSDPANVAYIDNYAETEGMDGQACALAMRSFMDMPHDWPVVYAYDPGARYAKSLGLDKGQTKLPVKLYPNPAQTGFTLEHLPANGQPLTLEVLDILGKALISEPVSNPEKHHVSLKNLPEGVYLVKVTNDHKATVYQTKVMKQN